jgi:WD40 repeat protein
LDSPEGYGGPYNFSGPFHILKLRKDGRKKEEREALLKKLIQIAEKIKGKYQYDSSLTTDIYKRGVEEGRGLSETLQFKKGCESVCKSIEGGSCPPQYCSELVYTLYSLAGVEGLKPEGLRQVVTRLEKEVFSKLNEGEKKLLRQSFVDSFLQDPAIRRIMDRNQHNQTQHLLEALTNPVTGGVTGDLVDKIRGPIFFPHNFVDEAKREKGAFCYAGSYLGGSFAGVGVAQAAQPVPTSPELFLTLQGHTDSITAVHFSPDGKQVMTGARDGTARVWDAETGQEIKKLQHTFPVLSTHVSLDGRQLVTGDADGTVRIWNVETGREVKKLEGYVNVVSSVQFSPDRKHVVIGSRDGVVCIWNIETGLVKSLKFGNEINSAFFSSDGKRVVTGSNKTVRIFNVETRREIKGLKLKGDIASFSPDGNRIVTGSRDNIAGIWDVETSQEIKKLEGHTWPIYSVDFSPNGRKVVTGSGDKTTRIWDVETGREIKKLEGHTSFIQAAHFSPNGKRVVTGSDDRTARIWATGSVRELTEDFLQNLYRSENGRTLTAEQALRNLQTPRNTQIWRLHIAALKDNAHLTRDNLFGIIHNTVSSVAVQEALKRIADELYAPPPP